MDQCLVLRRLTDQRTDSRRRLRTGHEDSSCLYVVMMSHRNLSRVSVSVSTDVLQLDTRGRVSLMELHQFQEVTGSKWCQQCDLYFKIRDSRGFLSFYMFDLNLIFDGYVSFFGLMSLNGWNRSACFSWCCDWLTQSSRKWGGPTGFSSSELRECLQNFPFHWKVLIRHVFCLWVLLSLLSV